jgi:Xaa-Pro dipeptidase
VWGDSCATVAVGGTPASALRRAHARVREALERALDLARPGLSAGALDEAVRADLDYSHHTGHGLGGAYYEYPRIVPGANTLLRPGMVVALEPAHYEADFGVRLEHVVLITANGAEDLSDHDVAL